MGNSDGNKSVLEKADSEAMDPQEWDETLQRHNEAQLQRDREAKAERAKASTAKARALLERLRNEKPRIQADIAAIRGRREVFGEPATVSETVMNAGQRQVRESYEQQRPAMDPATQKLWDDWCDARFDGRFRAMFWKFFADEFAELLGTATGEQERKLREEISKTFAGVREDIVDVRKMHADEIAKLKKEFAAKITKMRKETGARGTNVIDLPNPMKSRKQE